MITTVPRLSPVLPASPWWKTSHGAVPRLARMTMASETPYRARPIRSWRSLRVIMATILPENWPCNP